jgi:hypothetical protein
MCLHNNEHCERRVVLNLFGGFLIMVFWVLGFWFLLTMIPNGEFHLLAAFGISTLCYCLAMCTWVNFISEEEQEENHLEFLPIATESGVTTTLDTR